MQVSANFAQGVDTSRLSSSVYRKFSKQLKVSVAHLRAVVHVEAGRSGFWNDGNMKLLYEGHIAYRETSGAVRAALVKAGLAWPRWGQKKYGKASVSRDRLRRAIAIAGASAFLFASYGLGQVLGPNAKSLGYTDAAAMFEEFRQSEAKQLDGMLRFIKVNGILDELQRGDWRGFAGVYNGPSYERHNYHGRLAAAAKSFGARAQPVDPWADGVLRIGDVGDAVIGLQRQLNALFGSDLEVDGHFGRATEQSVHYAQGVIGLKQDGIVGPKTRKALDAYRLEPKPKPIDVPPAVIEDELRRDGSRTITNADNIKKTVWQRITSIGVSGISSLLGYLQGIDWRVIAVIAAVGLAIYIWSEVKAYKSAQGAIDARVDDTLTGKHIGRQKAVEQARAVI